MNGKITLLKSLVPMASCLEFKLELTDYPNHSTTVLFY